MPVSRAYRPDPQYPALGPEFADPVAAADFPQTILRYRNDRAAATVGLDTLTDAEWVAHFGRFEPLPGNIDPPLAQRYHGHQFRVYNPDLGDGRGFTFAQMREAGTGRLLDLGTKGSGRTPWSRTADGRLTLKGGIREVLAVVARSARLTARWMAAGFVHGVLNTDNMNITGESFDYGPYRFLPHNDPNFTAAYFDHAGLYSFGRQPEAVFWNLQQLAGALSLVTSSDPLVAALNGFAAAYRSELGGAMLARLGLTPKGTDEDAAL